MIIIFKLRSRNKVRIGVAIQGVSNPSILLTPANNLQYLALMHSKSSVVEGIDLVSREMAEGIFTSLRNVVVEVLRADDDDRTHDLLP
jgi:hypothetical protein